MTIPDLNWISIRSSFGLDALQEPPDQVIVKLSNLADGFLQSAPRTPKLSGMPSARNPQAGADKLSAQIDKLDILRERYSQAIEYMAWFEPAWSSMTDNEQYILSEFYMGDNRKSGATYRLMVELNFSESHVERLRSNALNHLRSKLFG